MYKDITGVILAGGKSSRMGVNKSFLKIGNNFVIEIIYNVMKSVFKEVIIITNEPDLYEFLKIKMYEDIYKKAGPIAGIHSGLTNSKTDLNFFVSCDMPLINPEIISSIVDYPGDCLIKVPKADGFIQQLCGVYKKELIPSIESIINHNNPETIDQSQEKRKCKVLQLIDKVDTIVIENIEDLEGYSENTFFNLNNLQDYEKLILLNQYLTLS